MSTIDIKTALANGEVVFGGWLQISHPSAAEAMCGCGFDFVTVDAEHGDCDLTAICNTLRGLGETPGFVRVRQNATIEIRQALDCGARGIFVPLVEDGEGARRAVAAAMYPPQGIRGFAYCRANHWGGDFDRYAQQANGRTCVFVMVETARGVANIEDIVATPGVDGVLIGPYDLSGSMNLLGQMEHPRMLEAEEVVIAACEQHRKAAGIHLVTPTAESIEKTMQMGYRLIVLGMDTVFLSVSARQAMKQARICLGAGCYAADGVDHQ